MSVATLGTLGVCAAFALAFGMSARLPRPSGKYAVGAASARLSLDPSRPASRATVRMWYPALGGAGTAPYDADGGGIKAEVVRLLVRTNAALNAPVFPSALPFPALVYVASWDGFGAENTALSEELASYGYVVIALDDSANESDPDPSILGALDLSSDRAFAATLDLAARKRAREAARVSRLIDALDGSAHGLPTDVARSIDRQRIAAIGYSFGGAVAYAAAQSDVRIGAAINLDGWLFEPQGARPKRAVPYLFIGTSEPAPSAADLHASDPAHRASAQLDARDLQFMQAETQRGGVFVTIPGADHTSFRDDLRSALIRRSRHAVDARTILRTVRESVVPFIRGALASREYVYD